MVACVLLGLERPPMTPTTSAPASVESTRAMKGRCGTCNAFTDSDGYFGHCSMGVRAVGPRVRVQFGCIFHEPKGAPSPPPAGEPQAEGEQIAGPCTFCGAPDHWRPDCPEIANWVRAQRKLDAIYSECLAQFSRVICTPEKGYAKDPQGLSVLLCDIQRVAEIAEGVREPDFEPRPTAPLATAPTSDAPAMRVEGMEDHGKREACHICGETDGACLPICSAGRSAVQPEPKTSATPLQRPNRTRPLTNEELKRLAEKHPPPKEWFEEEAQPESILPEYVPMEPKSRRPAKLVIEGAAQPEGGEPVYDSSKPCPKCGQSLTENCIGGEYPCPVCGIPMCHDPPGSDEETARRDGWIQTVTVEPNTCRTCDSWSERADKPKVGKCARYVTNLHCESGETVDCFGCIMHEQRPATPAPVEELPEFARSQMQGWTHGNGIHTWEISDAQFAALFRFPHSPPLKGDQRLTVETCGIDSVESHTAEAQRQYDENVSLIAKVAKLEQSRDEFRRLLEDGVERIAASAASVWFRKWLDEARAALAAKGESDACV